jgi:hypothetical protein
MEKYTYSPWNAGDNISVIFTKVFYYCECVHCLEHCHGQHQRRRVIDHKSWPLWPSDHQSTSLSRTTMEWEKSLIGYQRQVWFSLGVACNKWLFHRQAFPSSSLQYPEVTHMFTIHSVTGLEVISSLTRIGVLINPEDFTWRFDKTRPRTWSCVCI